MSTLSRRVGSVLRSLVRAIPPVPGPWEPAVSDGDEHLVLQDCTDEEIKQIRQVLDSSAGDPYTGPDELWFESSSGSDDEDWDADDPFNIPGSKVVTCPLKEAVTQFHIGAVSEDGQNAFTELCHSEEFQAADSFAIKDMRSDEVMTPFAEIGTILDASKATITKHGQRANRKIKGLTTVIPR
jgi:hypothetical protein